MMLEKGLSPLVDEKITTSAVVNGNDQRMECEKESFNESI